jgi:O-antigen polymerase
MQKSILLFLLVVFGISVFGISNSFANPITPTMFIAVGGCCVLVVLTIMQNYKHHKIALSIKEIFLGGFLIYAIVNGLINSSLNPEWIVSALSLGLFYLVVKRITIKIEWLFAGLIVIGIGQALYGLGQYVYWFSNVAAKGFTMSGSFDNPAGFAAALSVCFPFSLFLITKRELYWRILGSLSAMLLGVAVMLSESRAGVVAIAVIAVIWALNEYKPKWIINWSSCTKIVGCTLLIIILLIGLYFVKKDSANGRLLIWQCSAHMIADKPIFGYGVGGFQREYMLYQAEYFRNRPDSSFAMLADNVKHPFNEYLLLLIEHGLVGGVLFGFFIFCFIRDYLKNKNSESFYAILCLVGVVFVACFSYPMGYPFIRLITVFCSAFIMHQEAKPLKIPQGLFSIIKPTALAFSIALLLITSKLFYDVYRWDAIAQSSLAGETKAVMPDYVHLYQTMNWNGLFLYNYAAELNFIDKNKESNLLFIEASHFMNDIDLQLQMADNYQKMKQYKEAEKCLILASEMIPNRFIPLYRLAKLYEETNRLPKAKRIAKQLLSKPVKIISPEVITIKSEMRKLLLANYNETK